MVLTPAYLCLLCVPIFQLLIGNLFPLNVVYMLDLCYVPPFYYSIGEKYTLMGIRVYSLYSFWVLTSLIFYPCLSAFSSFLRNALSS